jgi:hypothetical protein
MREKLSGILSGAKFGAAVMIYATGHNIRHSARIHGRNDRWRRLAIQLAKSVQTIFDMCRKLRMVHWQNVAKALADFRVDGPAVYCAERN